MNIENAPEKPTVEEAIKTKLEQIQERATVLRLRAEENLARLKGTQRLELNEQQKIEQLADRLVQMFTLLRTARLEQNMLTHEGQYDFAGEEIAWEQMMRALKNSYSETIFEAASKLANTVIEEANRS